MPVDWRRLICVRWIRTLYLMHSLPCLVMNKMMTSQLTTMPGKTEDHRPPQASDLGSLRKRPLRTGEIPHRTTHDTRYDKENCPNISEPTALPVRYFAATGPSRHYGSLRAMSLNHQVPSLNSQCLHLTMRVSGRPEMNPPATTKP